jgi:hypothetical protein
MRITEPKKDAPPRPPPKLETLSWVSAPIKGKWKSRKERHTEKGSVTLTSSTSFLGRGDLRGTHGHQSNTLRGLRAHLSYRPEILNIL